MAANNIELVRGHPYVGSVPIGEDSEPPLEGIDDALIKVAAEYGAAIIETANKLMFGTNIAALGSKPFMVAPTKEPEVELGQGDLFDINDLEEVA